MLSPALKKFHDAIYCLTVPSATDRQAEVVRQLGEGNFEFVYGIDKTAPEYSQLIHSDAVDQSAIDPNGPEQPLTPGEVCCAWGHLRIYEEFLKTGGERALIFEDDLVDLEAPESEIAAALANVPQNAEIIYWGWAFGQTLPWNRVAQQAIDHVRSFLGLIDVSHARIRDRYIRGYNKHFLIAAENYLFHAYTITREAAEKMIEINTPISMPSDHAPVRLIAQGKMRGYLARTQLYGQRSFDPDDPTISMTRKRPEGLDTLPEDLKRFHGRTYVLTVPSAANRHEALVKELGEGNFEFFRGVDKAETSLEELRESGIYDEAAAVAADRRGQPMPLGQVCCALGHRNIYEDFLASDAERCLILEDDVVVDRETIARIDEILMWVPDNAELIYWGWCTGGRRPWTGLLKQAAYHVLRAFGSHKYNHTMIRNLYSRRFNQFFDVAGKHFGTHAYTVTRSAAEKFIAMNTPIRYNADHVLMQAALRAEVKAYICVPPIFSQRSVDPNDPTVPLT